MCNPIAASSKCPCVHVHGVATLAHISSAHKYANSCAWVPRGPWASHLRVIRLKYWALEPQIWGCYRGTEQKNWLVSGPRHGQMASLPPKFVIEVVPGIMDLSDLCPREYGLEVSSLHHG
jgi:hypothetical protein